MGERFGNYDLLEKVAVGGMAEIFKARAIHARGVEKLVCIKRIHPALSADRVFVAMFIDEARLGVSMAHGNIVPVFDFGYVDGHYFLAMEYVEGNDLATLCGRARVVEIDWPPQLAVYVVMEILEGLSYAHRKRDDQGRPLELVHRDVSPSNVLISTDGQVKLLDFGIARSQAREFETRTGVIKGKPGYMSPEQAAGQTVDARADVWSSGAVLYELLTGARLKDGRKKIDDDSLERVLDRALAGDREKRYDNALQMQEALAEVLEERSWRPYARDVSEFIRKVYTAVAPGENWDMKSTAVEKHLAEALESARPEEDDSFHAANARITETISDPPPATALTTTTEDRGPKTAVRARSRLTALLAGGAAFILAIVGVAVLLNYLPGKDEGAGTGQEPEPRKAAVQEADTGNPIEKVESPPEEIEGPAEDEPVVATLSVETDPPGASISVDGEEKGPAPLRIEGLEPGKVTVAARMDGRIAEEREVTLEASKTAEVKLALKPRRKAVPPPRKKATLNVVTSPWAQVVLDGNAIGQTPIRNLQIPAGKHTVVLTNPVGGITRKIQFSVKPGETKLISEKLNR